MRVKNNYIFYKDNLLDEYKDTFNKIEVFSMTNNLSQDEKQRQEVLMDILDMLLEAQRDGISPSKVVGEDIEAFCIKIFEDTIAKKPIMNLLEAIKRLMWVALVFSSMNLIFAYESGEFFEKTDSSISAAILAFILSYIIYGISNFIVRKKLFKMKKAKVGIFSGIFIINFLVIVFIGTYLGEKFQIEIKSWIMATISLTYLAGFYLYKIILKVKAKEKIFKSKEKVEKVEYNEVLDKQTVNLIVDRFNKKNERRVKKGKNPQSEEEFMGKFRKEGSEVWLLTNKLIYSIIFISQGYYMLSDTIIGVFKGFKIEYVLELALSSLFLYLYYRFIRYLYTIFTSRIRVSRFCIDNNKTVFEIAKDIN